MLKINLEKESFKEETPDSIEVYPEKYLGRYKLDKSEAITELNIDEILKSGNKYYVPAYQRGYRWTKQQVTELLGDIWEWDEKNEKAKYCLQPIVIINRGDKIEIVDGQQRLTTIFIVLRAAATDDINYKIEYETRNGTEDFLNKYLRDEQKSLDNIDWYHMHQCFVTAKEYFRSNDPKKWVEKLKGAFFIQYQILEEVDNRNVEQIFTALNAGKIPLTNSELVKALILRKNDLNIETYQNEFLEIALEWDRIEKRLKEDNFWAWLGQDLKDDTPHIDFVLDIVASLINEKEKYEMNKKIFQELYSYNVINKYFRSNSKVVPEVVSDTWRKVKQCFMTLEDWYSDNEIYHLIGYLSIISKNKNIVEELYMKYLEPNTDILDYIKTKILNNFEKVEFDSLSYESDKDKVKDVLLLFNIVTCIKTKSKFRFADYVKDKYDIEHISPYSGFDSIKKPEKRKEWINAIKSRLDIFSGLESEFKKIEDEENIKDDTEFEEFYKKVIEKTTKDPLNEVDDDIINCLGNLCLLDYETNRGYGNMPFPLKLQEIIKIDKEQTRYLLPTTKNVFLKYYSDLNIYNLIWDKSDIENYKQAIKEAVADYFQWKENDNEEQ